MRDTTNKSLATYSYTVIVCGPVSAGIIYFVHLPHTHALPMCVVCGSVSAGTIFVCGSVSAGTIYVVHLPLPLCVVCGSVSAGTIYVLHLPHTHTLQLCIGQCLLGPYV